MQVTQRPPFSLSPPRPSSPGHLPQQGCPILHGEERLKLLNYQNNAIMEIQHLDNLPNLIFLDLYNNRITVGPSTWPLSFLCLVDVIKSTLCLCAAQRICNLDCVPSLRVLMLGKNQISRIEGLSALRRLDVLDLHSNRISKIGLGVLMFLLGCPLLLYCTMRSVSWNSVCSVISSSVRILSLWAFFVCCRESLAPEGLASLEFGGESNFSH